MKVEMNSKKIKEGDVFIAIRGEKFDGHNFIDEAIKNGAKTIIAEHGSYSVDTIIVDNTKEYLSKYLKELYGVKLGKMNLIGITGTNGKTTTAYLIYQALNRLQKKCAYIGTIGFYMDKKVCDLERTTPDITDIYNMLLKCEEENIKNVVMEVSSHALVGDRVKNLNFNIGIFTNLTGDHLDLHKTIEAYALAKQQLFNQISSYGCAIINTDDSKSNMMLNEKNRNITYGFNKSMYQILNYCYDKNRMYFDYKYNNNTYNVMTKLLGKHNVYNLICLIAVLEELKISSDEIIKVISNLEAPSGRFEVLDYGSNRIVVDYAHTLDAVNNVLNTAKEFSRGKIYSIIGCGGDRDRTKRSPMLKSALELSDYVIITNDNPRTEDPNNIVSDMLLGNEKKTNYEIILDRTKAIEKGISYLNEDDTLMILGKGHENYQIIGDKKYHHDDKEIALQYIKKR